ncbi:hypothetical protein HX889_09210 [Pseudomonas reactans]|nr:hypothetical protein [Pseudomonas reactans]
MITQYDEGYLFTYSNTQYRIYNPYLLESEDKLYADDFIIEDRNFNQYNLAKPLFEYLTNATTEHWYEFVVEAAAKLRSILAE